MGMHASAMRQNQPIREGVPAPEGDLLFRPPSPELIQHLRPLPFACYYVLNTIRRAGLAGLCLGLGDRGGYRCGS